MRIVQEPKLNFEDVLLQPKRSTLTSRADVKMTRTFNFVNSGKQLEFCPIFASNMDGVGTFSMAKVLQEYKMMTVITKSTGIEQWQAAAGTGLRMQSLSVCTGTNVMWNPDAPDYKTMQQVLSNFPDGILLIPNTILFEVESILPCKKLVIFGLLKTLSNELV